MPQSEIRGALGKGVPAESRHETQVMQTNTVQPPETLHENCKMMEECVPSQTFKFHLNPLTKNGVVRSQIYCLTAGGLQLIFQQTDRHLNPKKYSGLEHCPNSNNTLKTLG